jgi:hypothetical protein
MVSQYSVSVADLFWNDAPGHEDRLSIELKTLVCCSSTKWYTVNNIWKHSVFAYPKRELYCFNIFCFEMARQITLSFELSWQPELARYCKTEVSDIVAFCFGISENTVFSNDIDYCPVHLFVISSSEKCLRVSKTESYRIGRICFEMTRQATMPSSSEKCIRVSKTETYGLSRICFEMTRQATMPSSKAWLCLADEQHNCIIW